jgi:hypothetical protein
MTFPRKFWFLGLTFVSQAGLPGIVFKKEKNLPKCEKVRVQQTSLKPRKSFNPS